MIASAHELAGIAVGPYSPRPGPYSITFGGGIVALKKGYGIDIEGMTEEDLSRTYEAKDQDGHTWFIRPIGFLWVAFRDRTAEEIAAFEDEAADRRLCSWFSSERLRYSRAIGQRVRWLVNALRPEHEQSRKVLISVQK